MNPRTRRAALYAIGVIAFLASANALGHSYAGLYDWATHHDLAGWQAMSWPALASPSCSPTGSPPPPALSPRSPGWP